MHCNLSRALVLQNHLLTYLLNKDRSTVEKNFEMNRVDEKDWRPGGWRAGGGEVEEEITEKEEEEKNEKPQEVQKEWREAERGSGGESEYGED